MWLVGLMGSGKTTVGREVARRMNVDFYDTDTIVEEMAGRAIPDLWQQAGEEAFRRLERRAVLAVPEGDVVAAAGGGAVLDAGNRRRITRGKPVIWLSSSPSQLLTRLEADGSRPLLEAGDSILEVMSDLLERRAKLYGEVATDIVETDYRSLEDVVGEVVEKWPR